MEPSTAAAPSSSGVSWRAVLVIAALAAVAWWVYREHGKTRPVVEMQPNVTAPPVPPPGVPLSVAAKMAAAVDELIPVVMTSGATVQYDDSEIRQIVRKVLDRVQDENLTLIQVASASKTIDSYKTVAYDIVVNLHDSRENVGLLVSISALVPLSNTLYVRSFRMVHSPEDPTAGPAGLEPGGGDRGLAAYEDPVTVLSKMTLPGKSATGV